MDLDPETIRAIAQMGLAMGGGKAVVKSGAWAGQKLFGPVLDEIGKGWADSYSQYRKDNLARIARNAISKGRTAIEAGCETSPRVVNRIVEDGSFAEGPLMAEYFGGIWASSLSPGGDDDRGLVWADLVSRLARLDIHL